MTDTSAPAPASTPDLTPSRPVYDGKLSELYGIYFRHLALMVLTLGWSRFWGRTRLRRYLWSHFAVLGDRLEYRGRGLELMIGFVLVLLMLGVYGGALWAFWEYVLHEQSIPGLGLFDIFTFSLFFLGIPLAFVGHYAGLRYRLTRTRWRGIRCDLAGSAWGYGAKATGLHLANGLCGQLLTPLMSVLLAQPRIANARLGTQRLEFAGRAGDIYGRFVGYYFLNILAWIAAIAIAVAAITWGGKSLGIAEKDVAELFTHFTPRTVLILIGLAFALYVLLGVMILPLRCWWQAYLWRYLVSHTRAGTVLFASALSTRQMWGFLVLNYLIVMMTLGLGWLGPPAGRSATALRRGAARDVRRDRRLMAPSTSNSRARYYDGVTAQALDVTVRPSTLELVISRAEGVDVVARWPIGEIKILGDSEHEAVPPLSRGEERLMMELVMTRKPEPSAPGR